MAHSLADLVAKSICSTLAKNVHKLVKDGHINSDTTESELAELFETKLNVKQDSPSSSFHPGHATTVTRPGGKKGDSKKSPWYTEDEFNEKVRQVQAGEIDIICGYSPVRGSNKGKFCGAPAVVGDRDSDDFSSWRCEGDRTKKGPAKKSSKATVPSTKPTFNAADADEVIEESKHSSYEGLKKTSQFYDSVERGGLVIRVYTKGNKRKVCIGKLKDADELVLDEDYDKELLKPSKKELGSLVYEEVEKEDEDEDDELNLDDDE